MVRKELQEMDNSGGADPDRSRDDPLNAIRSRDILADWLLVTVWG